MIQGQVIRMRGVCEHNYHPAQCPRHRHSRSGCCDHRDRRGCWHIEGRLVNELCGCGKWVVQNPSKYVRLMRPDEMEDMPCTQH